jgi:hypothetical protein
MLTIFIKYHIDSRPSIEKREYNAIRRNIIGGATGFLLINYYLDIVV